ncbi:MAG: hypothetical protein ACOYOK_07815 [Pseudobdellovibrionaceae bacterium]
MLLLRSFIFILCFIVEVRLKAEDLDSYCQKINTQTCLVSSTATSKTIKNKNFVLQLSPYSLVKIENSNHVSFIAGQIKIETFTKTKIHHPYFDTNLGANSSLLMYESGSMFSFSHKIYIQNFSKKNIVLNLLDRSDVDLPAQFFSWVGPISRENKNLWGMVQRLDNKESETAADVYQENAERLIASEDYERTMMLESLNKKNTLRKKIKAQRYEKIFSK